MKKIMTVLAASLMTAWSLSAYAEKTAASYVQDGLVGLWDAEENAGWGQHSATPEVWKNLVDASVEGRVPDMKLGTAGTFRDKAFEKTSAGVMASNETVVALSASGEVNFKTVEVVVSDIPANGDTAIPLSLTNRQMVAVNEKSEYRQITTAYWGGSGLRTTNRPKVATISVQYRVNDGKLQCLNNYQGGSNQGGAGDGQGYEPRPNSWLCVGCLGRSSDAGYDVTGYKVHSVRLYNRLLTDAERQQNLYVDKQRFEATVYSMDATSIEWTGAAGDDRMSTAGNWKGGVPPIDNVKFDWITMKFSGAAAITNDVGTVLANNLVVTQLVDATKAVTIGGGKFSLMRESEKPIKSVALQAYCPLTLNANIEFPANYPTHYAPKGIVYNGAVAIPLATQFKLWCASNGTATFNGTVNAPNATIITAGSQNDYFYGSVTATFLKPGRGYAGEAYHLYAPPGNDFKTEPQIYGTIVARNANVLPTNLVFKWQKNGGKDYNDDGQHLYRLYADQTCDRIESDPVVGTNKTCQGKAFIRWRNRISSAAANVTLTLKGTADATSYGALVSESSSCKLNLVWDPTGDYTQTIGGLDHTMVGEIIVKGGTFASAGTNTFQYVTALRIADGAKFKVTACDYGVATNPFTGTTALWISGTGKVSVPAGVTVTVNTAVVKGVPMAAGTYTATCGWVEGEGSVSVAACDGTGWKSTATSGNWKDSANWSNGVPPADGSKKVYLSVEGDDDYTVTMAAGDSWPKDLLISGANATLKIPTGADIAYDGNGKTSSIAIEDGGTLLVDGGMLVLTNFTGTFTVGSTVSTSSRVAVASGLFSYAPKSYGSPMTFKTGGLADVTDGELRIIQVYQNWTSAACYEPFLLDGGNMSLSGGNLNFCYTTEMYMRMPGEVRFSGNAHMATLPSWRDMTKGSKDTSLYLMPEEGDTLTWTFEDHASFALDGQCCLGHVNGGGRSVLNFFSDAQHYMPYNVFVGYVAGHGELNITNGVFQGKDGFPRGIAVGMASLNASDGFYSAEGVFNLSGGSVTICRNGITGWGQNSRIIGFDVGYAQQPGVTQGGPYVGTANISGGALTNKQGNTVIGMGLARGTLNVSGGTYYTYKEDRAHFVGLAGGTGALVQSGGEVSFGGDVYLGGAWTNATYQGSELVAKGWDVTRHDAAGTLVHSNGTFSVGKNLVLGADGRGTVDVVGSAGTFTVGGNLVFSNHVENAQSGGTLNYTFDENGVTPVVVAGKVTFRPGAKMAVDVSGYAGTRGKWLLRTSGGLENPIDPADVELKGATGELRNAVVRRTANGYRLSVQSGSCIIVR